MAASSRHFGYIVSVCFFAALTGAATGPLPHSVAQSFETVEDSEPYVAKTWTTEEGLPHTSAWALEQDEDGALWVGTLDGLARFDGHSFTTFTPGNTKGLNGNRFHALHQASDGSLWIGTGSGLSVRRNGQFRAFETPNHVGAIAETQDGTIWVSGYHLYRSTVNATPPSLQRIPLPDTLNRSRSVAVGEPDSIWVTVGSHLLLYRDGTFEEPYSLPSLRDYDALGLATGPNGTVWVGAGPHVLSIQTNASGERDAITRYRHDGTQVRKIRVGPSGAAWITTIGDGLLRSADGVLRRVDAGGRIPSEVIGLTRDDDGQWWVGGPVREKAGLIRLRRPLFQSIEAPGVHGLYTDEETGFWATINQSDELLQISASDTSRWTLSDGLPDNLWSVARDETGTVWVGSAHGLARRRGNRFEVVTDGQGRGFGTVQALYPDPAGGLWIYSNQRGLFRYHNGRFEQVFSRDRLSATRVYDLYRDRTGILWIGTRSRGVAQYQNGTLTWYDTDDGVPYKSVREVYETDDGTIWIGTYGGGMARFEGDRFTPVTPDHGLPAGTIHAIREAPKGIFWMTSNKGVFRVPASHLYAVADGERDRLYVQTFGTEDGLPSQECNGNFQTAMAEGPNGRFWIPTTGGLAAVDPYDPRLAVPDSLPVRVTEVRTDGTPQPLDSLRLAPSTYRLALDFTAVSLRHADALTFRYRLDDGPWTPAQSRRTAEFTTLDAGPHQFEVQATTNGETWYTLEAPLRFTVAPHFYETGWFRLLVVLGFAGLVVAAYLWRTRALRRRQEKLSRMVDERTAQLAEEKQKTERQAERLEALDEQKNRFFANVSHELRTPLTILKGTTQDLLDGAFGDLPAPAQRQLEIMRSNVDRLRRLTDQLLDLSRLETTAAQLDPEPRDLVTLLRHTVRSFSPLAERRGLTLQLEPAVDEHPCRVDPEKWEKIVGNLLSNALQNTPEGGTVRVTLDVEDGTPPDTVLRVADTGRGIAPERQDEIFERFAHSGREDTNRDGTGIGLSLVREYVDLHDGTITLDSAPGEGSTFTVRLPLPPVDADAVEPAGSPDPDETPPMVPDETPTPPSGDGAPSESDHPTLLIVEDNADVRAYLRRHLTESYQIVEATGGVEGLDRARETQPDLVLTDLMMPEMDGIELCRKIRADDGLAGTPVLLLTARAAEEDAVAGLEAGADAYVTKPFSMAELQARLQRLLEAQRTDAAASDGFLAPNVEVTSADEDFLARVTEAIDDNLSRTGFTIEDLAAAVGLSPRQLQRKLKRLTDTTPAAFVRRYRLDVAAQLLESEAGTVSEIAYEVGFGTPETFSTRFEERFGCPPSQYPDATSSPAE